MNHLANDLLYLYALNLAALSVADAEHLAACGLCRQELIKIRRFLQELAITQRSQPDERTLERYTRYFETIGKHARPGNATPWLRPALRWNGRQQLGLQGVRNPLRQTYRILYAANTAEVEIMVAPQGTNFTIDGEILVHEPQQILTPALIQMQTLAELPLFYETESTGVGRFYLESVAPGAYTLSITPLSGALIEIEGLEIS